MFDIVLKFIVSIGIPAIIVASVYIGRKLQILDNLEKSLNDFKNDTSSESKKIGKITKNISNAIIEIQTIFTNKT